MSKLSSHMSLNSWLSVKNLTQVPWMTALRSWRVVEYSLSMISFFFFWLMISTS